MKTPSLEEVRAHFKDAKEVKENCFGRIKFKIDWEKVKLSTVGNWTQGELDLYLWSKDFGYAEIISYKEKIGESAKKNPEVKQYKHIPTGNIVKQSINQKSYYCEGWEGYFIPREIVENSSDWEEVKPKEYEILQTNHKHHGILSVINSNPELHKDETIHSVKRLSDGEVFTVGDMTTKGEIHGFDIVSGILSVRLGDQATLLRTFDKINPVLFLTEDGVEIRKGDKFYVVDEQYGKFKMHETIGGHFTKEHKYRKRFSSKEKASEYVLMNKPCLSVNDIVGKSKSLMIYELVELAKSKISDQQ